MPHHIRGECGVILGSNILPYICNGDALTDTATHVLHGQTHWLMLIGGVHAQWRGTRPRREFSVGATSRLCRTPGRIGSHRWFINFQYIYNSDEQRMKAVIPRVDIAPHSMRTLTLLAFIGDWVKLVRSAAPEEVMAPSLDENPFTHLHLHRNRDENGYPHDSQPRVHHKWLRFVKASNPTQWSKEVQQLHQLPLQSVFEHSTWITIHKRNLLRPYYQKAREARS